MLPWHRLVAAFAFVNANRQERSADVADSGSATDDAWLVLCSEVAELRRETPAFLDKLGEVYSARQIVQGRRLRDQVKKRPGAWQSRGCSQSLPGPWRLKVDISPPASAPAAYRKSHRAVLVFTEDWPRKLPEIRFVGKIAGAYFRESAEDPKFGQRLHSSSASGLLLRRLQASLGFDGCMWRQTASCSSSGHPREPQADRLCHQEIPVGASGFCDCNGDGILDKNESGYNCSGSPRSCDVVCGASGSQSGAAAGRRFTLRGMLTMLHRSFGEPLDKEDARVWNRDYDIFAKEASTVVKYEKYGRKHQDFFRAGRLSSQLIVDDRLQSVLGNISSSSSRDAAWDALLQSGLFEEVVPGHVYSFPVLKLDFCKMLMEEIRNFYTSKLPAKRPNSMNNYGIILNDIGLESLVFELQDTIIQPLAAILFPDEGSELESHHSFTIRYKGGEDTHLDVHTDDSDITFNVNIMEDYTGAPLIFCGINGMPDHRHFRAEYQHKLGYAVLHVGRHRHGAEDITSGERMNLVVWSYSYNYRSSSSSEKKHQKEARPPDSRCVSYTHDRDFERFRSWPPGKRDAHRGRGWCPPRGKEYDGFTPDMTDEEIRVLRATQGQAQGQ